MRSSGYGIVVVKNNRSNRSCRAHRTLRCLLLLLLVAPLVAAQQASCKGELLALRAKINKACCPSAADCVHGVPLRCDSSCASLCLPFSAKCQQYIRLTVGEVGQPLRAICARLTKSRSRHAQKSGCAG